MSLGSRSVYRRRVVKFARQPKPRVELWHLATEDFDGHTNRDGSHGRYPAQFRCKERGRAREGRGALQGVDGRRLYRGGAHLVRRAGREAHVRSECRRDAVFSAARRRLTSAMFRQLLRNAKERLRPFLSECRRRARVLRERLRQQPDRTNPSSRFVPGFLHGYGAREARGFELLKEWLSPEQLAQYEARSYFDVTGWHRKLRWKPTSVARWPWRTNFRCPRVDGTRFSIAECVFPQGMPSGLIRGVETGSRQENASNQQSRAPVRLHRNGTNLGSTRLRR